MTKDALIVDPDRLQQFTGLLFEHAGVPREDAAVIADSLVLADLWGHQSHGVLRASWYLTRLRNGAMAAVADTAFITDAGAMAVLDGRDSIGQIVAAHAARSAINRAKLHGIGVVSVRNSNHFGTAMYFTRMAAAANCIGFLSTNGSPAMPPWGGLKKTVGTNPWSISAPAGRQPPMVLDIANTAVARGKLYLAKNRGSSIPAGWAIDREGSPTTDPVAALTGNILPMAGHKGYAISVMMDVLSGVLSGSRFLTGVHGPYEPSQKSGCGHLFIALNIAAFRPLAEFELDMERMIAELRSSPRAAGTGEIYYPGEIEAHAETQNRRQGLQLATDTIADLETLARAARLDSELPW